ncbi:MAG TPA: hypothetical protein VN837_03300 [Chloroflexota bacterium]|nr:hypothetical protein [Chloroflexota bacterium]
MDPFFASVYAYPWDVIDESVDVFCRNAREQLGVDTISLAVSYHAAKLILPHNPRRKIYYPEDGSLYFRPDPAAFADSPIQPHVGKLALEHDVLAELCQESARTGLEVIAWTVCLHNTRLGSAYPEYAPVNAFGDPVITYLCPAQPAARAYVCALAGDLAHRYSLKAIQLEAAHHMPFVHGFHHEMQQVRVTPALQILLGLCFCPACLALAREHGVNAVLVRRYVADDIQARLTEGGGESDEAAWLPSYWHGQLEGDLWAYMQLRRHSTNELLKEVRQAVQAVSAVEVHLQEASAVGAPAHSPVLDLAWHLGMSVPPAEGTCDGVSILGYFAGLDRFTAEIDAYRARIPAELPLEIGLRACIPDCDSLEELTAKVAHCATVGARGVSFYNYGMMPAVRRNWIREALSRARGN